MALRAIVSDTGIVESQERTTSTTSLPPTPYNSDNDTVAHRATGVARYVGWAGYDALACD